MSAHVPPGPETSLDLLVLADLLPEGPADAPLRAAPRRVEAADFAGLLRAAAPVLTLEDADGARTVLRFDDLRAFRPEALAAALPAHRGLVEVHRILEDLHRGRADLPWALAELDAHAGSVPGVKALREALTRVDAPAPAGPPPPPPAASAPEGGLFDLVDVEGSAAAPSESPAPARALDRLIRELAGGGTALGRERLGALTAGVDAAAAEGMRAVLHHPRFRSLESAWRGLAFLVKRVDPRSGIRVHVLAAPPGERVRAIREHFMPLNAEIRGEARTAVVLVDGAFGGDEDSLAEARELAALAEEARAPLIASADPALLGIASWKEIQGLGPVDEHLAETPPKGWTELRNDPAARWLTLAANPFLLRLPYGAELDRVKGFAFEENPGPAGPVHLWGRPAWIVGVLVAAAAARDGWGAAITGPAAALEVSELPVRPLELRGGDPVQIPLEMLLPENRVLELSRAGLAPVACARNRDRAFLPTAPSAAAPAKDSDRRTEALRVSLPYQIFTARVTALLEHLLAFMGPTAGPEETAAALAAGLTTLTMNAEGPDVTASAEVAAGGATLVLRLVPRGEAVRGLPPLELTLPAGTGR